MNSDMLIGICIGVMLSLPLFVIALKSDTKRKQTRLDNAISDSLKIVQREGLICSSYYPEFGTDWKKPAMVNALRTLGDAGYIITDKRGAIIGNIVEKYRPKDPPKLKLVVNNRK